MSMTERFSEILGNNMESYAFHILGCGAIGSSAATQLARMGATRMILHDMDTVAMENIGVSQYTFKDLDKLKVNALKKIVSHINPVCIVEACHGEFNDALYLPDPMLKNIIVLGFDSMASRLEATSYCSNMSGSFIANAVRKVITGQPFNKEFNFNFPTLMLGKK
jgi:tRNA A37 threonylcarbamoyladenosine dehydratase